MKTETYLPKQRYLLLVFLLTCSQLLLAQKEPAWLSESWRSSQYPSSVYLTGFVQDGKNKNETIAEATERVKNMARANLSESILASVQSVSDSYSESIMKGDSETVNESFKSQIKVSTNLEINGINTESFVDDHFIYGFAYANKYEVIGYYKANLNMQVQQIKGFISTAKELEEKREKIKAKDEYNKSLPVFEEIKKAQGILSALDKNITQEGLKMETTMSLYNEVVQANARLDQGVLVYMITDEDLFGNTIHSIENGLKAILAENSCSFTKNESEADWKIHINSSSRDYNYSNKVYFSYVDAKVELYKAPAEKHVYQNEFTQKGAHSKSYKAAAEKAYKDMGNTIAEEILKWINK